MPRGLSLARWTKSTLRRQSPGLGGSAKHGPTANVTRERLWRSQQRKFPLDPRDFFWHVAGMPGPWNGPKQDADVTYIPEMAEVERIEEWVSVITIVRPSTHHSTARHVRERPRNAEPKAKTP
jgi:hypothetical protein